MNVLLFVRSLVVGGSQRQIALLAAGLARRGHAVTVVVLYPGGAIEADVRAAGIRVVSLDKAGRWDAGGPLLRLRRLIRAERPDVVYAFLPTQNVIAALVLPFSPARLVFGIRAAGTDHDRYDWLSRAAHVAEAVLARRARLVIANGEAVRMDAVRRGLPAGRTIVIPNGIDTDAMVPDPAAGRALRRIWGLPDDAFVIGMAARLDPMKDHATFLAAAARMAERAADVRFVLVGDGPAARREELLRQMHALRLGGRVVWAGERSDMRAVYSAFDLATLTSAFGEGFPNVVGEAMACGRAVVASDVGDARLIIGDCGELVPPRNPALLCEAWMRMRQRITAEGDTLAAAARRRIVERFSVEMMVARTERVLAELCRSEQGGES